MNGEIRYVFEHPASDGAWFNITADKESGGELITFSVEDSTHLIETSLTREDVTTLNALINNAFSDGGE